MDSQVVSIIIRTVGRDSLKKAINSVVTQTYTNIELVVVNDSDEDMDWLKEFCCGSIQSLKILKGGKGRCGSANIGLENISGKYTLFLDDDDWIDKNHVQKLELALSANSEAVLAYTACSMVDDNGDKLGEFDFNIDNRHILIGNYMPIHSVLFRSDVIQKGCRFDENIDIYEDWDFWIQLKRYGFFLYTEGISAYYLISKSGNSSAHNYKASREATIQILNKWRQSWSDDDLLFLANEAAQSRLLQRFIENNNKLVDANDELSLQNKRLILENDKLSNELKKILSSKSWALTKPLRYTANIARYATRRRETFYKAKNKLKEFLLRKVERGSSNNGNILYQNDFNPMGGEYICIFSHFDKHGLVDDYVIFYLRALRALGCDIVFVSTAKGISSREIDKIRDICSKIIIKENIGYDFGAWSDAICLNIEYIKKYKLLILCNDSVYAPLYNISDMFNDMKGKDFDAWSITDSLEIYYHMQSYFLVFKENVFNDKDFFRFWSSYKVYRHKRNIIEKYEIGLSRLLIKKGFKVGAYCETKKVADYKTNTTHSHWKNLIMLYNCPSIKIELVRDNPLNVDISDLKSAIEKSTDYNFELISNHIKRVSGKEI